MEEKKVSINLRIVIIISIILVILVLGIVFFTIYKSNNNLSERQNTQENSSSNLENNSNQDNTSISSITGKSSSKTEPLSIGEWGIASKYSSGEYSKYVDVPVKISNITRGDSAAQQVKEYCNSSIYTYEDAKTGMEWAVIEYNVDLTNIQAYYTGEKNIKVDSKVTGTGDSTAIKYKDHLYFVSTLNMTNKNTKETIATGLFAVQLPIGCTDYIITLGSISETQAFFSGK